MRNIILTLCISLSVFMISCSDSVRNAGKGEQVSRSEKVISDKIINKYKEYDKKPVWAIGRDIINKLNAGEFSDIEEYMDYLVAQKSYSVDGKRVLENLYQFVGDRLYNQDILDKWCATKTPHHSSYIIRGVYYMNQAWIARGHGFSYTITPEGAMKFRENLELAKKDFEKAFSMNPHDPNSAGFIIRACMGLGDSEEERETWFKRAIEADPVSYTAYSLKQNSIRPKWGGTPEEDKAFAEYCYENAPPKSIIHEIMLDYIIENYKWTGNKINYYNDPSITKIIEAVAQKTLKNFPDSSSIRKKLAEIETTKGNNEKAIAYYSEILAVDPGNPDALRLRAKLYSPTLNKNTLAEADIKKSLESDPDGPNNYDELAQIALINGEREKAIEYYTKAIEREPMAVQFYVARGIVKMRGLQNYAAALEDFKAAEKIDPMLIPANLNIAICLEKIQRFAEARDYCLKTLRLLEMKKPREGVRSIPPAEAENYRIMLNALLGRLNNLSQNPAGDYGDYIPAQNSEKESAPHEQGH